MVYKSLRDQRASAYTTVTTVMGILHEKGWLRREHRGRAWEYEPTLTREQYLARVMLQALRDTEDRETLFACIAEALSSHDSRALRAALRRTSMARGRKARRSAS